MADTSKTAASDDVDQASNYSKYRLKVTAGPAYDPSTHQTVHVNSPKTLTFENEHILLSVAVRIRNFTGFPPSSPETCDYFDHNLHTWDQYSISFSFIPKVDIPGNDLVFGNDFDRPIRDRLPPGFNQAFKIVKWWIDPGLEGDVYADRPYLYGPALSSWNILKIGEKVVGDPKNAKKDAWKIPNADGFHDEIVEEGGDEDGEDIREDLGIPDASAARKKFFLTESNRQNFTFEAGRLYQSDFGNPYLDFNNFALKLPGFSLNVIQYVDSKTHELRYTLKNKKTDEVYCCVLLTLLFGEELTEEEKKWDKSADAKSTGNDKGENKKKTNNGDDEDDDANYATPDEDDVD